MICSLGFLLPIMPLVYMQADKSGLEYLLKMLAYMSMYMQAGKGSGLHLYKHALVRNGPLAAAKGLKSSLHCQAVINVTQHTLHYAF